MLPWLDLSLVDLQNNPWNCDCNLKWVAETLIPDLQQKNPQTTLSLMYVGGGLRAGIVGGWRVHVLEGGYVCVGRGGYVSERDGVE